MKQFYEINADKEIEFSGASRINFISHLVHNGWQGLGRRSKWRGNINSIFKKRQKNIVNGTIGMFAAVPFSTQDICITLFCSQSKPGTRQVKQMVSLVTRECAHGCFDILRDHVCA